MLATWKANFGVDEIEEEVYNSSNTNLEISHKNLVELLTTIPALQGGVCYYVPYFLSKYPQTTFTIQREVDPESSYVTLYLTVLYSSRDPAFVEEIEDFRFEITGDGAPTIPHFFLKLKNTDNFLEEQEVANYMSSQKGVI